MACARQPLPPSACAQPRHSEMGLFKRIVQRLVQCLPPSGSRSWAALRFLALLPTLSHGRTKTQKVLGRAGWVGDCQSRISFISLDTATAGRCPGRRAGGAGDAGEERTRGAPSPASPRPWGRRRPREGSAGAELPCGRSSLFHFLIRGPRPRAVIGAGGQVVAGRRGVRVCVCAGVCLCVL